MFLLDGVGVWAFEGLIVMSCRLVSRPLHEVCRVVAAMVELGEDPLDDV